MKKFTLQFIITFLFVLNLNGQNYFYLNDNRYESTKKIIFKGSRFMQDDECIIIAKKNDGSGLIAIETDAGNTQRIMGKLTIYLENGELITCIDRKLYDWVNNRAITTYYLTKNDIEKLKKTNIQTIRYNIQTLIPGDWSSDDGSYITKNSRIISTEVDMGPYVGKKHQSIDTTYNIPALIYDLFK